MNFDHILVIILAVFNFFVVVIGWLMRQTFKDMMRRVGHLEEEAENMKENYLDRFEDLKESLKIICVNQGRMEEMIKNIDQKCAYICRMPFQKPSNT